MKYITNYIKFLLNFKLRPGSGCKIQASPVMIDGGEYMLKMHKTECPGTEYIVYVDMPEDVNVLSTGTFQNCKRVYKAFFLANAK